jgi:hypothetical protein
MSSGLADAGSIPAGSTKPGSHPDPSIPSNTLYYQRLTEISNDLGFVSVGADWPPKRHQYDTRAAQGPYFLTDSAITRVKALFDENNYRGALLRLKFCADTAFLSDFDLSLSDPDLRDFASKKAKRARRWVERYQDEPDELLSTLTSMASPYGITPPELDDPIAVAAKMSDKSWWTARLRQLRAQHHDTIARDIGFISKKCDSYAGYNTVKLHRDQQERNKTYLENTALENSKGERISLAEIAEHNLSNPVVRNAEFMVRLKGFEQVGALYGHKAQFITLTTPSRFHCTLSSGAQNPKFDGSTVADGQKWLKAQWSLIRAKLHRKGISPYGFRIVEPHHDGTPHWHMLLFTAPQHVKPLDRIIRHYMLSEFERGSEKHRVKTELIDPEKGSAVGYIAKYVSKNLDGKHLDTDLDGKPAIESAERITAWARTWNIRQFQQIGGPSVTVWRELRKLKPEVGHTAALANARTAADSGDWAAFVIAMGGIDCPRKDQLLAPYREYKELVDVRTGEITFDDLTPHGAKKTAPLKGLRMLDLVIITRSERWTPVPIGSCARNTVLQEPYEHGAVRC